MTIENKIRNFIQQHLYFSEDHALKDDDSFLAEGVIDSMGAFELATFVETEFGIKVQTSEIVVSNFDSVIQLADFVRRKLGAASETAPAEAWPAPAVKAKPVPLAVPSAPAAAVLQQVRIANDTP